MYLARTRVKWLISAIRAQFLGDIGQPLHVEVRYIISRLCRCVSIPLLQNYEVGGNEIDAKCSGTKTSLHAAWGTPSFMNQRLTVRLIAIKTLVWSQRTSRRTTVTPSRLTLQISSPGSRCAVLAFTKLSTQCLPWWAAAQTGSYQSLTRDWLSCTSTTQPVSELTKRLLDVNSDAVSVSVPHTIEDDVKRLLARASAASSTTSTTSAAQPSATITPLECPLVWARESNALCCVSPIPAG